ncbi:hypothetical protein AB6A40_010507 [Gnathostoma spinigerum]|uniref:Uncharacterized protein n=1 Tax=Gnathostoma spinigerum TaxID=75299 RepID=A0ABD6EV21_9BILA
MFPGVLGIFTMIIWHLVASNSPDTNKWISDEESLYLHEETQKYCNARKAKSTDLPWMKLLTSPCMVANVMCQFSINYTNTMLQSYLPTYFKDVLYLDLRKVTSALALQQSNK